MLAERPLGNKNDLIENTMGIDIEMKDMVGAELW